MEGLLAGKKFLLLRRSKLKPEAKKALSEPLLVSPRLLKAYVFKESFAHVWDFHVPDMGHEGLPKVGRGLEMETSDASQEVCGHGGRASRRDLVLLRPESRFGIR